MAIEHDFFGVVDDDGPAGVRWSDVVEFEDQPVDVVLQSASVPTVASLELAAGLIRSLGGFDTRARDALIAQLSERGSATTRYVDNQVDVLGDELAELLVHTSGDMAMDVLRSLQLLRVDIDPEDGQLDDPFAVFEYALDPDDGGEVLTVTFDRRANVVAIELSG